MKLSDSIDFHRPRGVLRYVVKDGGRVIEECIETNLVVDQYKAIQAALLAGGADAVTKFGVGTSGATPLPGNTTLTSSFTKSLDSHSAVGNVVTYGFSLASGEANGLAIMEFGLLTTAGLLFARRVRIAALNKTSALSLSGTWQITF